MSRNGGEKWLRDMEKEAKERMERNKKEKKKPWASFLIFYFKKVSEETIVNIV